MNVIVNGHNSLPLNILLEFLVAWEKRPACLTPIAYEWCSAISRVAEPGLQSSSLLRFKPQARFTTHYLSEKFEGWFSSVGPHFDPVRMGEAPQTPTDPQPGLLLVIILEVGFRLVTLSSDQPALHLNHTPHHDWVFESIFSNSDDEVIADGVCAWVADSDHMPTGPCMHYLTERTEDNVKFSPRLRQMCIHLVWRVWNSSLWKSDLETVGLLNCLDICVDEMEDKDEWGMLLTGVVHSPAGHKNLSVHYWHLLERFPWKETYFYDFEPDATELVGSLEKAGDWEKLEAWMVAAWQFKNHWYGNIPEDLELLKQVTLKHLLRRPSALPRFESLVERGQAYDRTALEGICAQERAKQLPLEPLPP